MDHEGSKWAQAWETGQRPPGQKGAQDKPEPGRWPVGGVEGLDLALRGQ